MPSLSIIIPVFNEEETILHVLQEVEAIDLRPWNKEIIVVDDGSHDKTVTLIQKHHKAYPHLKLIIHKENKGKGAAVQTGMKEAKNEYIIIQDADLEYDPVDIPRLLLPIQEKRAEVVFGTRLKRLPHLTREERNFRFLAHYFGNRMLSLVTSLLYNQHLTDMETGYKVFPRSTVKKMNLRSQGFEFEPEITINLIKQGKKILEVPIKTNPRGYEKGKKLQTIPDGIKAMQMILKHRI